MPHPFYSRIHVLILSMLLVLASQIASVNSAKAADSGATLTPGASPGLAMLSAQDLMLHPMRGFNLGRSPRGVRPEKDFTDLASTGAKLVRVMLDLHRCDGCAEFSMAPAERLYLDRVVSEGAKHGFRVVINLCPQPGGALSEIWDNDQLKASLKKQWVMLAKTYGNNPVVAGYDLINEPNPTRNNPMNGEAMWRALAEDLIAAIREVDPSHMIFFEPTPGALPRAFENLKPLKFSNIVYSVHFYEPHQMTHQGLPDVEGSYEYPGGAGILRGRWDKERLYKSLDSVRQFAHQYSVPIYVGEFSFIQWAPNNSAYRYVRDAISLFEQEGWSWTYHAFRESPVWDAELPPQTPERKITGKQARQARTSDAPLMKLLKQCIQQPKVCR